MKVELALVITALLVLGLGVMVYQDTQTSKGVCQDVSQSVCVQNSCPDGYVATLDYACTVDGMTCCVPN